MFSVPISVVLLVFFVSQGQTSSTATLSVSPSPSSAVVVTSSPSPTEPTTTTSEQPTTPSEKSQTSSNATLNVSSSPSSPVVPTNSATPTNLPTNTSEQPPTPSEKTCAKLGVVIDKLWSNEFGNNASEEFRILSGAFSSALKKLYSDSEKYTNVEVSEVHFTEKEGKVLACAKLCLVLKEGVEVFIEDVFKDKVATGKLDTDLSVIKDSAEFEPLGVSFKDGKAKEGECEEKCEGAAGPFSIVKQCKPDAGFSCDGLKEPTEETDDCAKYCSSTVAVSVSFVILVIGIFLSSSFQ